MERTEAIKKIRQMSLPKETMEILEALAPELKESRNEQIRKAIIKSLDMPFPEDNLPGTDVAYKEAVSWLEKQKDHFRDDTKMIEQKPAEWSEKDEDKLEQCIKIVSGWEGDYDIVKSPYSNFLKSLRPSWRPSEEQMKALQNAVVLAAGNKVLAGLYEQLKQL